MAEEHRPLDPTRRLLRVFGVKTTDYDEKTARLMDPTSDQLPREERLALAAEAVALTEDLNEHLRNITSHVLDTQSRVLGRVKQVMEQA